MLSPAQSQVGKLLYTLAVQHGASPVHAREFVNAAFHESTLNPSARNSSSGAGGLFQLLSSGYVQKANRLGGVNNPRANALAILPDYLNYWRSHPHAVAGEAASRVERSGEPASWYAAGLNQIPQFGGGAAPAPSSPLAPRPIPSSGLAATPDHTAFAQALISQIGHSPQVQPLIQAMQQDQPKPQPQRFPAIPQVQRQTAPAQAGGTRVGAMMGRVKLAAGADRPGVRTSKAVLQFVRRISAIAGHAVTITTGSNHSEHTVNGSVSDHWYGAAGDIAATGEELIRLGQAALIAAGANPAWARRQRSYAGTINGHQIIYNVDKPGWGDHRSHLHVSAH